MNEDTTSANEFQAIEHGLKRGHANGLMIEVMWSAMCALKVDPKLSIEQAVAEGLAEWDC